MHAFIIRFDMCSFFSCCLICAIRETIHPNVTEAMQHSYSVCKCSLCRYICVSESGNHHWKFTILAIILDKWCHKCYFLVESTVELHDIVSLFPDTDLTLTTERLVELFASMHDRNVDLMVIYLGTPSSKSKEFQMTYQNPAQGKEAYLDYYVHNHPLASWTKIAETLHGCGLLQQATVVEDTYIQGSL